MFGLLAQYPEDTQEKLLVFQLPSQEEKTKDNLLTQLCGLLADVNNNSDQVSYIVYSNPAPLLLEICDLKLYFIGICVPSPKYIPVQIGVLCLAILYYHAHLVNSSS